MSNVDFAAPEPSGDVSPRSSVSEPSARRRNRSDAGRNLWRKADSVSDMKHFQISAVQEESRKLKRTNSSVAHVQQPAGGSITDTEEAVASSKSSKRNGMRRLQFTSLRNPPISPSTISVSGQEAVKAELELAEWIGKTFCEHSDDVVHYVAQDGGPTELLVITTTQSQSEKDNSSKSIHAIVSTLEKDEKVSIAASQLRPSKGTLRESISKGTLSKGGKATSFERKLMSYIRPEAAKRKLRRGRSSPELMDGLLTLVKLRLGYLHADRKFKVGVLHWTGEVLEEDVLAKSDSSPEFQEFLDFLGTKVRLKEWSKFAGGLDTSRNIDGKYSIHTEWKDSEFMFHVSTLLAGSPQQKKIHIGNDPLVIVFADSDKPFSPEYVQSKFNQVFIVISVEKDEAVIKRVMASPRRVKRTVSGPVEATVAISPAPKESKRLSLRLGKQSLRSLLDKEASESAVSPRSTASSTGDTLSPRSFDSSGSPRGESPRGDAADRHRMSKSTGQLESPSAHEMISAPSAARIKKRVSSNVFESKSLTAALAEVAAQEREKDKDKKKRSKKRDRGSEKSKPAETDDTAPEASSPTVFYRISVLRRDGVPCFAPPLDTPTPVFKRSKKFRDFLLSKIANGMVAAYESPSFQDRIKINRRLFLENLKRVVVDSSSGGV